MEEFVSEFDLTNQQIVLLNGIDTAPGHDNSNLSDFINSPGNVNSEYGTFMETINPENSKKIDRFIGNGVHHQQQHVIKNRNGVRYLKFKKSKKVEKTKLVDQHPQQCPVMSCRAIFTSTVKLKKHVQEHAYKKKHRCDICFEEFNILENLTLHISLHSGDGRCPQCGKIFRRLASLEGHIKTHFKNEYYMCSQGCDEIFDLEWMLKQHINQFHPNENAKIQQEKEELAKERKLRRKNLLNCQYCGKQFLKTCLLIRHERIHNGQKPFKCSDCDRCFAQKNTLVIHQRRHSDQRMFKCTQCPQTFVQKGNLISHVSKCHTYKEGEPSFPCNQCSCIFKKIGTLNAHISKFHSHQGVFMQPTDDLSFKIDDVMQQLSELHRASPLEAELISKELFFNLPPNNATSEEVQNDENINNDNAVYRNGMATQSSQLKLAVHTSNGMVTHRNVMQRIDGNIRWYVCLYCPKEFRRPSDLVRHIRIHTKEKPYSCPVDSCTKRFSVKSSLNTHLNTHLKTSQEQTCRLCQQTFHSADSFDDHCRLTHQDNPMFQCFICSQLCVTNGDLKRHLKCHRSTVKLKKSIPQKESDDGIQLDIIMKDPIILTNDGQIEVATEKSVPDQERKFECTVCFSSFKRKGHLKEHVLSHLGVKSHKCDICFKSFGKTSILNRHLLYHSNEKKFKCGTCSASFISNNQLNRHSLKHTNQRNVMCPYCQKRFKSKATCRTHMLIHKTEWVKQFKEQIKSGTIQFEEDATNQTNEHIVLDNIQPSQASSTNEHIQGTLNGTLTESFNAGVHDIPESNQILFTNLVQETQIDDSGNQFEYFLLLPTNSESNENGISTEVRTDAEQFIVNDEPMSFTNLHFIQLDQPPLMDMQNSSSTPLLSNYRLTGNHLTEEVQSSEPDQQTNLNSVCDVQTANVSEPNSEGTRHNVVTAESNQSALTKKKSTNSRPKKSTKSTHTCEVCSKIFQKPIDLRRHIRTHTLEKPFSCTLCPKAFSLKSTLENHVKHRHMNIKQMFPCTVCWKGYSSRHSMITHMLIHSNSRPFKCEFCTISFRTRGHLKIHQQVHLRESRKYGVNPSDIKTKKERGKSLALLNVMTEYSNLNGEVVDENVDVVDQNVDVVDQNNYTQTLRVERLDYSIADEANFSDSFMKDVFQCSACSQQFSDVDSLKVHLRTHKEKCQCPDCQKIFKKPSLLKRHMTVHFGRKEFICKICQKSYTQKATLQAHMSLHADGALFECLKCQKKFNFKTNLRTHEKKCIVPNHHEHSEVT